MPEAVSGNLGEEQVAAKWREIAPIIDELMRQAGAKPPDVPRRSAMSGDDTATAPYYTSHAVRQCLTTAVDHLHAVKQLVYEDRILHLAAPASLSRAVIENAAAAIWMLHPASRAARVERTLRWFSRNVRDQYSSVPDLSPRTRDEMLQDIAAIAAHRGLDEETATSGYKMSTAVKEAEQVVGLHLTFAWNLCSGFAHGRPWTSLSALDREELPTSKPGTTTLRLTNDSARVLYPVLCGLFTVQEAMRLDQQRRAPL